MQRAQVSSSATSTSSVAAASPKRAVRRDVVQLNIPLEGDVYTPANRSTGDPSDDVEVEWLGAGSYQPILTYEEGLGFDKRQILADDGYWSD